MDRVTRDFIGGSQRLAYLLNYETDKEHADAKGTKPESKSFESELGDHLNMNQPEGHERNGDDAIEDYLYHFQSRLKKQIRNPKFVVQLVGTAILLVYTVYTACMYRANRDSADAGKKSADAAQAALISSNRAWIEIELGPPWKFDITNKHPVSSNELLAKLHELSFPLTFANIGKSPAKNIEINNVLEVLKQDRAPSLSYQYVHRRVTDAILFPSREYPMDALRCLDDNCTTPSPIPNEVRQGLENGDGYVAIFSRATYSDEFGTHWLHFCTSLQFSIDAARKQYPTKSCVLYNDSGDGEEPK